jgi:hypothetical protein
MQRRRKLIDMSQDDLFSFRPRSGRGCSPPWRWFKAQIEAGWAGDAPRRGDIRMWLVELDLTGGRPHVTDHQQPRV